MTPPQHINDLQKYSLNSGARDVNIQDQTTPPVIVPLSRVNNTTALTSSVAIDDRTIVVDATAGFVDGVLVTIASVADNRYYVARQVGAVVGNTVALDTPLDFAYLAGAQVTSSSINMNVNGSVTTQVFSLRASDPGLPLVVDITRVMLVCVTTGAVDFTKFGDIIGGLTNGIVLRRTDGTYQNIFNAKTNEDLGSIMFDFAVYEASNPAQGQNGFTGRFTFAGSNKIGVAIRLRQNEDLELLVQDDLSTLLTFRIIAEGHVVIE